MIHAVRYFIIPTEDNATGASLDVGAVADIQGNTVPRSVSDGDYVGVPLDATHMWVVRLYDGQGYEQINTNPGDLIVSTCAGSDIPFQAGNMVVVGEDGSTSKVNSWWLDGSQVTG